MHHWLPAMIFIGVMSIAGVALADDTRCASNVDLVQLKRGIIGNEKIAVAVALTYLTPIYGEDMISREMPLRASLSGGIWTVNGTLPTALVGGTAQILLCQRNGAVLSIIHSK
ncbi:NTF2 fold immunity protein [Lichenifustis flavocetrariae]|uniref:YbbC/YhhH family protein n=1 Tax=Lichenifustis flavocetrariae TaxID=2949735 RepID=A0AA42CK77_9HYPH|nr:NTF2 fold immunity protein [Lichenifustis flavocetrariae]MCW6510308.1 YbbC/YhhH family protein [Lichenifustis flavocetrariae]